MKSHSRLIAPTILSCLLCGLFFDYLSYKGSNWSVLALLWKVLGVLVAVLTPPEMVAVIFSNSNLLLLFSLAVAAIATVWLVVIAAKRTMRMATTNPDKPVPIKTPKTDHHEHGENAEPDFVGESARPGKFSWGARGALRFAFVALAFCLAAWFSVNEMRDRWYDHEIGIRSRLAVEHLVELITVLEATRNYKHLADALERFSAQPTVAYFFVVTNSGKVLGESKAKLMTQRAADPDRLEPTANGSHMRFNGEPVFESSRPMGEADDRSLYVGIRKSAVIAESRSWMPIVVLITGAGFIATATFSIIWLPFAQRLRQLAEGAELISLGEMNVQLEDQQRDEVGDIARSIERMRSSLRAVDQSPGFAADTDPHSN